MVKVRCAYATIFMKSLCCYCFISIMALIAQILVKNIDSALSGAFIYLQQCIYKVHYFSVSDRSGFELLITLIGASISRDETYLMNLIRLYINYIIITGGQWRHLSAECRTNDRRSIDRCVWNVRAQRPSDRAHGSAILGIRRAKSMYCFGAYNFVASYVAMFLKSILVRTNYDDWSRSSDL